MAIAGIHGILWELLRRSIKKGQFGVLFNQLSSLESLSRLVKLATVISAVTLTITVASAFLLLWMNPIVIVHWGMKAWRHF